MAFARRISAAFAVAAAWSALLGLAACTTTTKPDAKNDATTITSSSTGAVAMFTPSDSVTLNQQTPLNTWAKLTPDLTNALTEQGFKKDDIEHSSADTLEEQSRQIQDYVVDRLSTTADSQESGIRVAPENTTLVVAPVAGDDTTTRQYGDYVAQTLSAGSAGSKDDTAATGKSDDKTKHDDDDTATSSIDAASLNRLTSALKLAQDSGMHVVLMAHTIEGYSPDLHVNLSDAQTIGELQAQKIVTKLALDKTSKDNPKRIEVLLPYDGSDSSFIEQAFQGIWRVLQPYFTSGQAISPSGKLDVDSDATDWRSVAFDASADDAVATELQSRLAPNDSDPKHVDGIIALNDSAAEQTVDTLTNLGYKGSAADINPQITISGIVDNIAGKKDLTKKAVPEPSQTAGNDDEDATDTLQWPLITGYGAYTSNMPNVVNGKQWMTGFEDRKAIATDIAKSCVKLNAGQRIDDTDGVTQKNNVLTMTTQPVAVSASNLKAALIDPGYITLADAGM